MFPFELVLASECDALLFLSSSNTIKISLLMYILRRQFQIRLKFVLLDRGRYRYCHTETMRLWKTERGQNWSLSD